MASCKNVSDMSHHSSPKLFVFLINSNIHSGLYCGLWRSGSCVCIHFKYLKYIHTQLPLRHRPQYKPEWMFEFINDTNNFGLPMESLDSIVYKLPVGG